MNKHVYSIISLIFYCISIYLLQDISKMEIVGCIFILAGVVCAYIGNVGGR